ncbi:hypothetical protein AURDEDRAFT_169883 [Auricularia subglabra TFB-10046 SS5]|nr:hypothetical protein AURDEDRAFT_169883 [Auricularia subglabra TFB-10046 SS5]
MLLRPLTHIARRPSPRTFAAQVRAKTAAKADDAAPATKTAAARKPAPLRNAVGVQLLSRRLHEQLFPGTPFPAPPSNFVKIAKEHLALHGLDPKQGSKLPDITFDLPPLQGDSIDEHFHNIGRNVAEPYLSMASEFAHVKRNCRMPSHWNTQHSGWTRYHRGKNPAEDYCVQVDSPDEQLLCFDVETMPHISPFPIMATARSTTHWYSWLSPWLLGETEETEHLIPLGDPSVPRIVVGHNVSYDRARIREEYNLERTATRFIDTMSLHVAVKGISSHQRPAWMKWKKEKKETIEVVQNMLEDTESKLASGAAPDAYDELLGLRGDLVDSLERLAQNGDSNVEERRWEELTSANSLADVAMLHCGITVRKAVRDDFLVASREEIAGNLDKYLGYCGTDVKTTYAVFRAVFPKFVAACPSPVSFAGVMSMGSAFLTVNQEWENYLQRAEAKYRELERAVKVSLLKLAKDAVQLSSFSPDPEKDPPWAQDVWLSQLDWTPKQLTPRSRRKTVIVPTIPAWLAELYKGSTANSAKRSILPLFMQARYFGYPLFLQEDGTWVYGVPKGSTDESRAVPSPEFAAQTGGRLSFFLPALGRNIRSLVTATYGARVFANGTFAFRGGAAGRDLMYDLCLTRPGDAGAAALDERFWAVAREVARAGKPRPVPGIEKAEPGDDTWWGDQLNWTPVPGSLEHHRPISIPAWYRELLPRLEEGETPPPFDPDGFDELDLTTRSAVAPLLLKLGWRGHPLFRSREHGWMYRVPRDKLHEVPAQETAREFKDAHDVEALGPMLGEYAFFKLPHKDGEEANVGNPLSKTFMKYAEDGTMTSPSATTRLAIDLNAQSSYWVSARDRVLQQLVVWDKERLRMGLNTNKLTEGEKWGMIIPQVITMGTVTRRAIEKTWLTASNAKSNRIGSELKAMVRAPPGYAIVGADVDSEELWISSVMGDAQFGLHGATAIGWMTLEGTKSAGTDLHSKTASILGISRNDAKVFNYSRIYGAGMKHASLLLLQSNPGMSLEKAQELATELYVKTKGRNTHRTDIFDRKFWFGGSESYVFNKLEEIAMSNRPQTPALGCGVTDALAKEYLPQTFGSDYLPSRINWVVQSSGVDYLHLLIVSMEYLLKTYDIKARYLISVHDELRYLVVEEDKYRCALALQIANLWTRCQFAWRLGMDDLPQGVAFFSAVDVDWLLRKEVDMPCVTPSQLTPLAPGESLDMRGILEKTHSGSLRRESELSLPLPEPLPRDSEYTAPNHMSHRATTSHFLKAQATQEFGEVKLMAKLATKRDYTGSPGSRTFGSPAKTKVAAKV